MESPSQTPTEYVPISTTIEQKSNTQKRYTIYPVRTNTDLEAIKILFKKYVESLGIDLSFQSFDEEFSGLPGKYSFEKDGELLIARLVNEVSDRDQQQSTEGLGEAVGCIALRCLYQSQQQEDDDERDDGSHDGKSSEDSSSNNISIGSTSTSTANSTSMKQTKKTGELKRLYITPSARGHKISQALITKILEIAVARNYTEIKLDTLSDMKAAQRMYEKFGFVDIEKYCENPVEGVRYMGLDLERYSAT